MKQAPIPQPVVTHENVKGSSVKEDPEHGHSHKHRTAGTAFAVELDVEEGAVVREARMGSQDEWDNQNGGKVRRPSNYVAVSVSADDADESSLPEANVNSKGAGETRSVELGVVGGDDKAQV